MRPWNQPTTLPSARFRRLVQPVRIHWETAAPCTLPCQESANLIGAVPRPQETSLLGISTGQINADCPAADARQTRPPPAPRRRRQPPAESRDRRNLLRAATDRWPRSSVRLRQPERGASCRFAVDMPPDPQQDLFGHCLDAGGQVHVPLLERGLGRSGRTAEKAIKTAPCHRQALAILEILHVQPEAAIGLQIDQAFENQVFVDRLCRRETSPSACIRRC